MDAEAERRDVRSRAPAEEEEEEHTAGMASDFGNPSFKGSEGALELGMEDDEWR